MHGAFGWRSLRGSLDSLLNQLFQVTDRHVRLRQSLSVAILDNIQNKGSG